jgi:hypothetical protein
MTCLDLSFGHDNGDGKDNYNVNFDCMLDLQNHFNMSNVLDPLFDSFSVCRFLKFKSIW